MKTVYQVRHAFSHKNEETGERTYFTRANEHTLADVVGEEGLEPYIATGSVVKLEAQDDYRGPGEPRPEGEEAEVEAPVFSTAPVQAEEGATPSKRKTRKR